MKENAADGFDRAAAAAYIADLAADLSGIAKRNGLSTLGYLLDMAKMEAENISGVDGRAQ